MHIKNIILDFGGVILDVDYNGPVCAFKKFGIENFDALFSRKQQEHFFDNYEKGNISDELFRQEIRNCFQRALSDEEIDAAWNALLFSIPKERMEFLKGLKNKYRLFLLSNTNIIHIRGFTKILDKDYGENVLEGLFEKMYFSCYIHMRKPDKEIFNLVLDENNLRKEETIFIDDSIQHVEGAKKAGLPAHFLDLSKNTLETFLPEILRQEAKYTV